MDNGNFSRIAVNAAKGVGVYSLTSPTNDLAGEWKVRVATSEGTEDERTVVLAAFRELNAK